MRGTVEEIRHTVHGLLQKKRESDPDPVETPGEPEESSSDIEPEQPEADPEAEPEPAPTSKPARSRGSLTPEPADRDDAFQRVAAIAAYLRRDDASSPVSYLLVRAVRFGELRAAGSELDQNLLEAPATQIRLQLRKAATDGDWQQVLETAENAAASPCGRGWLDAHRYAYRAAYELGYYQVQAAIRAEVNALLADYPALRQCSLIDDTPAANPETQAWLDEIAPAPATAAEPALPLASLVVPHHESHDGDAPDGAELARAAASEGRYQEAMEILAREAAAERSGRGRFRRRLELAQLCMAIGYERIAQPILEQLAAEVDARGLENWESPAAVAEPLALLYRCLSKTDGPAETKQKIYDRICRLDPLQAMACAG
jgi:type VI secretion system protein ImpA